MSHNETMRDSELGATASVSASHHEREIEMYRRERERVDGAKAATGAKRKLELTRGMQQLNIGERDRMVSRGNVYTIIQNPL